MACKAPHIMVMITMLYSIDKTTNYGHIIIDIMVHNYMIGHHGQSYG